MATDSTLFTVVRAHEETQAALNGTTQTAGSHIAFTVETRIDIPVDILRKGEGQILRYIKDVLRPSAEEGAQFTITIGRAAQARTSDKMRADYAPPVLKPRGSHEAP